MKTLKIGFDAKRIFNNATGLGVYGRGLANSFIKKYPDHEYYFFTPKKSNLFDAKGENIKVITPSTSLKSLWRSFGINNDIQQAGLDIYHGLSNEIPFKLNPSTKYVCTIHDLIWLKMPETYNAIDRVIYTKKLGHACKHSDLLIATSQQTADDLQEIMKVPESKIRVLYQSGTDVPSELENKAPIADRYFFYLSSFEKRKNHIELLKAYSKIKNKSNQILVLAGKEGETLNEVKRFIKKNRLQKDVRVLTNLTEREKYTWLKFADAFVYPSQYEGFGIPLIEAMQLGTPLLLNNIPVFREIAGETADFFEIGENGNLGEMLLNFDYSKQKSKLDEHLNNTLLKFSADVLSSKLNEIYRELS